MFASIYLLGLNVISLQHSLSTILEKKSLSYILTISFRLLQLILPTCFVNFATFSKTKFFTFLKKKAVAFTSYPVFFPIEKRAVIALIERFNQHLRGPPALA